MHTYSIQAAASHPACLCPILGFQMQQLPLMLPLMFLCGLQSSLLQHEQSHCDARLLAAGTCSSHRAPGLLAVSSYGGWCAI